MAILSNQARALGMAHTRQTIWGAFPAVPLRRFVVVFGRLGRGISLSDASYIDVGQRASSLLATAALTGGHVTNSRLHVGA
ncbi:hypothetical protein [Ramlibacter sp.]|uniref:hypothetical protein n=1 Tax=Ramlibacter sp. TaxID=1917967 RepID=UPI00183FB532|nr:hypothetical protein [Ramlibacter sp.]MBA2676650.1 hypothetical protein [Ramlibacter sp.]